MRKISIQIILHYLLAGVSTIALIAAGIGFAHLYKEGKTRDASNKAAFEEEIYLAKEEDLEEAEKSEK